MKCAYEHCDKTISTTYNRKFCCKEHKNKQHRIEYKRIREAAKTRPFGSGTVLLVARYLNEGLTIDQIAAELDRTVDNVREGIAKYGTAIKVWREQFLNERKGAG